MVGATAGDGDERLLTGETGRLLLSVSLGWALAGVAVTVVWGIYALLQYPSGRLSDRLSRTTLLVGGLLILSVGFLALAGAPTYPALLAGAAVVGLGAGLYPTPARGLVSDLFVARRGRAFGLHTASGDVGGILAAGLATAVLAVATWRAAFGPVVAVLLAVAVALHRWRPEPYAIARVDLAVVATGRRLLARRSPTPASPRCSSSARSPRRSTTRPRSPAWSAVCSSAPR